MKFYSALAVLCLSLVACTHDDGKKTAAITVPSRVSEHKVTECPMGIAGRYQSDSDPTLTPSTISLVEGTYYLTGDDGDSLPVTGVPTTSQDGSASTAICVASKIYIHSAEKAGHIDGTLSFTSNQMRIQARNTDTGEYYDKTFTKISN